MGSRTTGDRDRARGRAAPDRRGYPCGRIAGRLLELRSRSAWRAFAGGPVDVGARSRAAHVARQSLVSARRRRRVGAGTAPSTDAVLADGGGLVWSRRQGSIVVESAAGASVSVLTGANGPELSTDRLIDAAAYGTGIALLTKGFVELAGPSTALRAGALHPAPDAETLESATINNQEVMWLTRSGSVSIWNDERRAFELARPGANPLEPRVLAEIGPLRLTRAGGLSTALRAGAIEGALRVADLQGQLSWIPIDLSGGRFPFDVVRSIAVVGGTVYVGTDAGLQTYDGTNFALEHRLITLAADASAAPPTIDRVGESCDAPVRPLSADRAAAQSRSRPHSWIRRRMRCRAGCAPARRFGRGKSASQDYPAAMCSRRLPARRPARLP